ncbi:hypothetical protein CXG81DRAFT_30068 [Caulochytrium protostelioides]|uniref:EF-hand domain-containing protein n=1 Tax=Caulochytrium protostelioides TaxID=1555241 RepID=A0A4P9X4M1_9FUNG|nr:hypothetical protein CXG81DRAFT_30068 [Caulochytrium protostelioides]|eukprot:RKO99990.1 hypothetical protein CXG81DRAFT_30068 [Caulochytrium protostelioides]
MATRIAVEDLLKATNFTRAELETVSKAFADLDPVNDKVDRAHFRDLLADTFNIDSSLIMDRIFRCFDLDADNYISHDEFVRGMAVFLKGTPEERQRFCFRVYDLNGDKYIVREEMYQMLKNCLVKGTDEDEDGVKELVDLVLKKLDEDKDGKVNETDWATAIAKENLLQEAFGPCLPSKKAALAYLANQPII